MKNLNKGQRILLNIMENHDRPMRIFELREESGLAGSSVKLYLSFLCAKNLVTKDKLGEVICYSLVETEIPKPTPADAKSTYLDTHPRRSKNKFLILNYLSDKGGPAQWKEIRDLPGLSRNGLNKNLRKLLFYRLINKDHAGKGSSYSITPEGREFLREKKSLKEAIPKETALENKSTINPGLKITHVIDNTIEKKLRNDLSVTKDAFLLSLALNIIQLMIAIM